MHLTAAQGWLELGNHEEANEELELIDAPLGADPDVLEVRWGIYAKVTDWEACLHIGKAMVKLDPRPGGIPYNSDKLLKILALAIAPVADPPDFLISPS